MSTHFEVRFPVASSELPPSNRELQWRGREVRTARPSAGMPAETMADSLDLRVSFVEAMEDGRNNVHMERSSERQYLKAKADRRGVIWTEEITG